MNQALHHQHHRFPRLHLGGQIAFGSLTLFPLFGDPSRPRRLEYQAFAAALRESTEVTEMTPATRYQVLSTHPGTLPILIFEGELIHGGFQDRVIQSHTLIPPSSTLSVGVRCIEHAGEEEREDDEVFALSDRVAPPVTRARMKRTQRLARGRRMSRHSTEDLLWMLDSTGASQYVIARRRTWEDALLAVAPTEPEQLGWLVFAHGKFVALDYLSQPAAWRDLSARLLRGYALEAQLESWGHTPRAEAEKVLNNVCGLPWHSPQIHAVHGDAKKRHQDLTMEPSAYWPRGTPPVTSYRCHGPRLEGTLLASSTEVLVASFAAG